MNLKSARRFLQFALPATLLITSCASGASAAGTTNAASENSTGTANAASEISAETETDSAAEIPAGSESAEVAAASTTDQVTVYAPAADYPNPYEMETYDSVPEYLSERHDDVDYGTLEYRRSGF